MGWPATFDLPVARWLRRAAGREPDILLNHLAAHEAAIRAGLGIGVLPHFLAEGLELTEAPAIAAEPLWLVALASGARQSRVGVVYEEIAAITQRILAPHARTTAISGGLAHLNLCDALDATRIFDSETGSTLNSEAKSAALAIFEGIK